jgi:hypothetical protein
LIRTDFVALNDLIARGTDLCLYEEELTSLLRQHHLRWQSWFERTLLLRAAEAAMVSLRQRMREGEVDAATRKQIVDRHRHALTERAEATTALRLVEADIAELHSNLLDRLPLLLGDAAGDAVRWAALSTLVAAGSDEDRVRDRRSAAPDPQASSEQSPRLWKLYEDLAKAAREHLLTPTIAEGKGQKAIEAEVRDEARLRWLLFEIEAIETTAARRARRSQPSTSGGRFTPST